MPRAEGRVAEGQKDHRVQPYEKDPRVAAAAAAASKTKDPNAQVLVPQHKLAFNPAAGGGGVAVQFQPAVNPPAAAAAAAAAGGGASQDQDAPSADVIFQQANVIAIACGVLPLEQQRADDQRILAIRAQMERVNAELQANEAQKQALQPYLVEMQQMAHDFQYLAGSRNPGFIQQMDRRFRNGLTPFIHMLRDSIEPSTTRKIRETSLDELREHNIQFDNEEQKENFIRCYLELLLEAIQQNIQVSAAAVSIAMNLIWNDNVFRIGASLVGTYFSIVLAAESLILFGNTIIGAITFGYLTIPQLTALCGQAYHSCTWNNFAGLLVYMGVPAVNVHTYIVAIQDYTSIQIQYIIMTVYIMYLRTCTNIIQVDNSVIAGIINSFQIQNVQLGAVPADAAACGQAAAALLQQIPGAGLQIPPQPAQAEQGILVNVYNGIAGIASVIKDILYSLWNNGIRFSAESVNQIFRLCAVPGDPNTSFRSIILGHFGNFSNFMSQLAIQRSRLLSPDDEPNKRAIQIIFKLIGLDLQGQDIQLAFDTFSTNTLTRMRIILENSILGSTVEYNTLTIPCLTTLSHYFLLAGTGNVRQVNLALFQELTNFIPLLNSPLRVRVIGQRREPELSQLSTTAEAGDDTPVEYIREYVNPNSIASSAEGGIVNLAGMIDSSTKGMGILVERFGGGDVTTAQMVARRQSFRTAIMAYCLTMVDGFTNYMDQLVARGILTKDECDRVKVTCTPIIQDLQNRIMSGEYDRLIEYIIYQNPSDGIPVDIITQCKTLTDKALEAVHIAATTTAQVSAQAAAAAAAATTNAVASWGASFFGLIRRGGGGLMNSGRRALACILPAPVIPLIPAGLPAEQVGPFIDQFLQRVPRVDDPVPDDVNGLGNASNNIAANLINGMGSIASSAAAAPQGGMVASQGQAAVQGGDGDGMPAQGGGRSRKRSASKRTRRKAKQPSKKLKRKSRRYVRRRRSTRRKN
jgi:hypothetical protein